MEPASANAPALPTSNVMTWSLMAINVVLFASMVAHDGFSPEVFSAGPRYETLMLFGAKENGLIALGEIWRLFTPMFLHANLIHLGFNMYAFYQIGSLLEMLIGPSKLLALYVIAGVSGNLCSFAFSDKLSVGASSSLFGALLFLYVLQKYMARRAEELGFQLPTNNLGFIILLNVGITFMPAIDWAAHLGGAIGGSLLGLSSIFEHKQAHRIMRASHYLAPTSGVGQPPWLERPRTYHLLLMMINILLFASIIRVGPAEKIWGLGISSAAAKVAEARSSRYLSDDQSLLTASNSETNPQKLLALAVAIHKKREFNAAASLYEALLVMLENGLGTTAFQQPGLRLWLVEALTAARRSSALPSEPAALLLPEDLSANPCRKAGELVERLHFYALAGRFFECSWYLEASNLRTGGKAVEMYWRSRDFKALSELMVRAAHHSVVDDSAPNRLLLPDDIQGVPVEGEPI